MCGLGLHFSKQTKCPLTEGWIKKMSNVQLLRHTKNKIKPSAATRMDLEIIILSEVSQRQTSCDITHMWSLMKNGANELIYKTETDSQILKSNLWLPRGNGRG